jgi:hypothetical protein
LGPKNSGTLRSIVIFAAHQFIGSLGVVYLSTYVVSAFGGLLAIIYDLFGHSFSTRPLHWIMTETPYFPIQIAIGAGLGWTLYRRFRHLSMLWVWIVPFSILSYAVVALPTFSDTSIFNKAGGLQSSLSHYFGWGCQPRDRCFDQILITLPTYSAVAYSLGAFLARKMESKRTVIEA